jgi:hypothetical protein
MMSRRRRASRILEAARERGGEFKPCLWRLVLGGETEHLTRSVIGERKLL